MQPSPALEPLAPQLDALASPLVSGRWANGLVVGLLRGDRELVRGYGATRDAGPPPDEHTLFEIGSVTKAFTGLLLADMLERRDLSPETTVQSFLPAGVVLTAPPERLVLLVDLATHTAGLPRLPATLQPPDLANPYADFHAEQLLDAVSHARLATTPGTRYEYSNFGYALLGWALAQQAGASYRDLLHARILAPLGLTETTLAVDGSAPPALATPHDADGDRVPAWQHDAMAPAGALRSSLHDMLRFVRAQLAPLGSLASAIARTHVLRHATTEPPGHATLGWHAMPDGRTLWHNGQTGGFHSYVAFDPGRAVGVVVLANTATPHIDALGASALRLLQGLPAPPILLPPSVALDNAHLERLAGTYRLGPGIPLVILHAPGVLRIRIANQPAFRLHAASPTEFRLRVVDASLAFELGDDGHATAVTLHQNGVEQRAVRAAT